jgi:hypothetical protein
MLNKLLERLNGHAADAAALAEALEQLGRERIAARTSLKELQERRRQALLDDASDAALDRLEREIDRGQSRIEKLDMAEAPLREQLSAAQAAAAKRAEDEAGSKYLDLAERSAAALEAADVAFVEQRLYWDKNQHLLRRLEPLGAALILGEGHGVAWAIQTRKHIAEARAARARRDNPQPAPRPPAIALPQTAHADRPRLPHERARLTDGRNIVTTADGAPGMHSAPREADDLAPLEPGQARVRVQRHGYSPSDDRPHCSYGQIVRMPLGPAERAADRGAVVIIEVNETVLDAEGASQASPSAPQAES